MRKISIFLFLFLLVSIFIFSLYLSIKDQKIYFELPSLTKPSPFPTPGVLGQRTKHEQCRIFGPLPDKDCTPGAIFPNVTKEQICTRGYSQSVRDVSVNTKRKVYDEYGISSHKPGEYEVDHLISLELGGSNDIANLWPEPAEPRPGFHEKDLVENYLHFQLCSGKISLQEAQQKIANDWYNVYHSVTNIQKFEFGNY